MTASLEERLRLSGNAVKMLRHSSARPDTGPLTGAEITNWRDEQRGWRKSCAMFDLSHHMTDITLRGADTMRLLSHVGVNSWANFRPGRAKQIVSVNDDGFVIGDAVAEYLQDGSVRVAGMPSLPNWMQFQIEAGKFNVEFVRDEPTALNPKGHPAIYRFQLQGPRSFDIVRKAVGGPIPEIKFFQATDLSIAGHRVIALGHGMARSQGLELIGPWADVQQIREALILAGEEFGLAVNGSRAPASATLESGWIPAPLPAIYTGDAMKPYRSWLPGNGYEGAGGLGGSFMSDDIREFYFTPHDLGYVRLVSFDHEFIGRDALKKFGDEPERRKVTLEWNTEDVMGVIASQFRSGTPGKWMEFPIISFSTWQYDKVVQGEKIVGISTFAGYSYNERKILSLATVDSNVDLGEEVKVIWGEEDGGAGKVQLEHHVQTEIRARVCRVPYSDVHNK